MMLVARPPRHDATKALRTETREIARKCLITPPAAATKGSVRVMTAKPDSDEIRIIVSRALTSANLATQKRIIHRTPSCHPRTAFREGPCEVCLTVIPKPRALDSRAALYQRMPEKDPWPSADGQTLNEAMRDFMDERGRVA